MKLTADESIEKSLEKLKARTKKPSFNNNKGLTKIKRYILLDAIDFIQQLVDSKNSDKRESSITFRNSHDERS
ncbi:MAG: hypothetical protein KAU90_11910 [Sulfurovaceae bacterium]|nr:hypothetical protein [Sulfurovaceae bacterium]